jgi:hypothetical protein
MDNLKKTEEMSTKAAIAISDSIVEWFKNEQNV